MSVLNPSAFYLLPLLGLILFFYLLKGKPRQIKVSSTLFWQKIRQTLTSQRFRWRLPPELLLFLQLTIFGILIVALAQLFLTLRGKEAEYVAIVIDTTASMQATDVVPDRLSVAKRKARDLIRELSRRTRIALIQADDHPRLLVNFSDDRAFLLRRLEALKAVDVEGDEEVALKLAASLFPSGTRKKIFFFTDGAFEINPDSVPRGTKLVLSTSKAPRNIGITSLKIRPRMIGERNYEVLVGVGNFSSQEESFTLSLHLGGKLISKEKLSLPPHREGRYIYSVKARKKAILRVELEPHPRDDLSVDNLAYAIFGSSKNLDVLLVSKGNLFLETALSAYQCINLYLKDRLSNSQEVADYDLVIFDGISPPSLDQGNVVLIGVLPPGFVLEKTVPQLNPVLTEWEVEHPLLRFVDLSDVNVERALPVGVLPGGKVLARSGSFPLIQVWQKNGLRLLFLAFDLYQSDFPLQVGFPIFIFNLLQWFHPELFDPNYYQIQTGKSFPIPTEYEGGEVNILSPHKKMRKFEKVESGLLFSQTQITGVYKLNGEPFFAANLTSSEESNLLARASLPLLEEEIGGRLEEEPAKRKLSLSPFLVLISFLLLLVEWYLYHFPLKRRN